MQAQQGQVTALRTENRRLEAAIEEVDMLRHDDVELKQLAQSAAEIKKANHETARVARVPTGGPDVQTEIDRSNREGQTLVEEYKVLNERANDPALTDDARAAARIAVQSKLEAIKAKQRAIQDFIARAREGGVQGATGDSQPFHSVPRSGDSSIGSVAFTSISGLRLPGADGATVLATYEKIAGLKVVRDPSLAAVRGTLNLQLGRSTKEEAMQALQGALRDQLNIVLEQGADGAVVAKLGPPR